MIATPHIHYTMTALQVLSVAIWVQDRSRLTDEHPETRSDLLRVAQLKQKEGELEPKPAHVKSLLAVRPHCLDGMTTGSDLETPVCLTMSFEQPRGRVNNTFGRAGTAPGTMVGNGVSGVGMMVGSRESIRPLG